MLLRVWFLAKPLSSFIWMPLSVLSDFFFKNSNVRTDMFLFLCFHRHFAENGGYFQSTTFEETVMNAKEPITFYDSVTGKPLFVAPINRSAEQFVAESKVHGW